MLLLLVAVLLLLQLQYTEGELVNPPCGDTGIDNNEFVRTSPRLTSTSRNDGAHIDLSAFFMPWSACEPTNNHSIDLRFPVYSGGDSQAARLCTVLDPRFLQDLYAPGTTLRVDYGIVGKHNDSNCCCCRVTVPSGVVVAGATLRITGEYNGFVHHTVYPFRCDITLKTRSSAQPLARGEKFFFTYVAETNNIDGGASAVEVFVIVVCAFLVSAGIGVMGYAVFRRQGNMRREAVKRSDDDDENDVDNEDPPAEVLKPTNRSPTRRSDRSPNRKDDP